jgi:cytochrome c-type biogenesis protein CcmE
VSSPSREATGEPVASLMGKSTRVDPSRKRAIRLVVALTAALLLASALIYTSFSAGRDEVTAGQLLRQARPGQSYILAGTVLAGSVHQDGSALLFRVRDPKLRLSVPVRYTGIVPDPFRAGRGVLVTVHEESAGTAFVGEQDSLTTKCPSKYQAVSASY